MGGFRHSSWGWQCSHISFRKFKSCRAPNWQLQAASQKRITSRFGKTEKCRNLLSFPVYLKGLEKAVSVGLFYFLGFQQKCLHLSTLFAAGAAAQKSVNTPLFKRKFWGLMKSAHWQAWPAGFKTLKAAAGGISQPLETVSVLWVCSSAWRLFAREAACWVGLLSSQELRKGERARP